MNLVNAILAENTELPPIASLGYEYVLGRNGLFIRAEDSRLEALIPIVPARLHGLADLEPYACIKIPRLPATWLHSILKDARKHLPNECLYQFVYLHDGWHCVRPQQKTSRLAVNFADTREAVVDLHSHNTMSAF